MDRHFRSAWFRKLPVGCHVLDEQGRILYVNETELSMLGYKDQDMIGHYICEFVDPREFQRSERDVKAKLGGNKPGGYDFWRTYVRRDGTSIRLLIRDEVLENPTRILSTIQELYAHVQLNTVLREPDTLYLAAFNSGTFKLLRKNREHKFIFGNDEFCKEVGVSLRTLRGMTDADFFPGDLPQKYQQDDKEVMESGEPYESLEWHQLKSERERRWVHVWKAPLFDYDGQTVGVQVIYWDVKDNARARRDLHSAHLKCSSLVREYAEIYSSISEKLAEGFYRSTPTGRYLSVNKALASMYGYASVKDLESVQDIQKEIYEDPKDRDEFKRRIDTFGIVKRFDYRIRRPGRSPLWISEKAWAKTNPLTGDVEYYEGIIENIDEHKQMQERSRQLAEILDSARYAIFQFDLEGQVLDCNPGATELYGWAREDLIGQSAAYFFFRATDEFEVAKEALLRHGEWNGRLQQRHKDGSELIVSSRWTLLPRGKDSSGGILVINTDITKWEAAERLEGIGTSTAKITHDFKTVLHAISGYLECISSDAGSNASLLSNIGKANDAVKTGMAMCEDLLTFARKKPTHMESVDCGAIVGRTESFLKRLLPHNVSLHVEVAPDLFWINADSIQMGRVLMNLVTNARDAMPNGGQITIRATHRNVSETDCEGQVDARPGRYVVLSVKDNGRGIPPEILPRIFEPFVTTKPVGQGTGLGLATVYGTVKTHHGWIKIDTCSGKGTTFEIFLPAVEKPVTPTLVEFKTDEIKIVGVSS